MVPDEIAEYLEVNRDQINKAAYDGDYAATVVLRAFHLNKANGNKRNTRIVFEAAIEAYRKRVEQRGEK